MGLKAYVCQVCSLYSQTNTNISDVYDESKKLAEKKIKEKKEEIELEMEKVLKEEEIDLTTDEFEEEEEVPDKFEKRKLGKEELEDTEEFGEVECPFCGEMFDNLAEHIQECEFAPDDVSMDDVVTSRKKKKKKASSSKSKSGKNKIACPYCGKMYVRLGRHLPACKKRPDNPDEEKEEQYINGEIDSI